MFLFLSLSYLFLFLFLFSALDGKDPVNFRENGYLYLADHRGKSILERNNEIQKSCGVDWIHLYSPKELG